jgi:5-methylcytosine-specific restriction protein A
VLCGKDLPALANAEIDHIVERADGGTDEPSNLRTLCVACHADKTKRAARARRMSRAGQANLFEKGEQQ